MKILRCDRILAAGVLVAVVLLRAPILGEENANKAQLEERIGSLAPLVQAIDPKAPGTTGDTVDYILKSLVAESPNAANELLGLTRGLSSPLNDILEGLTMEFKTLDSSDALGIGYVYDRDIAKRYFKNDVGKQGGVSVKIKSSGDIAFNANDNPNDFIDGTVSLNAFFSRGGIKDIGAEEQVRRNNELVSILVDVEPIRIEEFERSPEFRELFESVRGNLSDQYYVNFDFEGGVEADQRFDAVRNKYGMHLTLIAKGWGEDSGFGAYNFLDYPAALVRYLFQYDDWKPRGSAFPEFQVGLNRIMPKDATDPRTIAGDSSDFSRFEFSGSYRSEIGRIFGEALFLEATLRYYSELNASLAVEVAGLDSFSYFTAAFLLPRNYFVSYSEGKLPLDVADQAVYQIGLRYNF